MSISPDVAPTVPAWQVADEALADEIRRLDQAIRSMSARTVELAAQAAQRGLPGRGGHRRLSQWLREVLPTMAPGEASRLAGRAETLFTRPLAAELAPTRQALLAAAIRGDQADVIAASITAVLPPTVPPGTVSDDVVQQAQTFLLEQADVHDASGLRRLGEHLTARLDPDADDRLARDEHRQHAVRGLTLLATGSGMVHLEGLLTARCGAALAAAIDAWSAPRPAADGAADPRTAAQRRHDALQRLSEDSVARPGLLPRSHRAPYRIVVSVGHETLAATMAGRPVTGLSPALLPDNTPLSAAALAEIGCQAEVVPVLKDAVGNPLDVGDTQYAFPARQRTAITARDRHCTWPGCDAPPPWCDIHHLTPFSAGGPTSVVNGTLLCGHHHRHVHTTGVRGRLLDGTVSWTTGPPREPREPDITRATQALDHLIHRWLARRRQ